MSVAPWISELVDRLARQPVCGYGPDQPPATEPTSLAALALMAHGNSDAAAPALDWLKRTQACDGSLGVTATEPTPCWPTALAMLAWQRAAVLGDQSFTDVLCHATDWLLTARGEPLPRSGEMGHDCTLIGWSWVLGTHSWMEPTAWSVLALKSVGHGQHRRTREAVRLLEDRLLPDGGCNYGNTTVLGQPLRPHVQPTGLTLLALAGERATRRTTASIGYLRGALSAATTAASLSYGLLGLAAHRALPPAATDWLTAAAERHIRSTAPAAGTPEEGWGEGLSNGSSTGSEPTSDLNPLATVSLERAPKRGGMSAGGLRLALILLAAASVAGIENLFVAAEPVHA